MSYTALYRKFRPVSFEDVKGQDHIVTTLKNQLKAGRIGHAYLFCGTRGTGKTTVAKILARAVNCEHPKDGSPCNECDTCKGILSGTSTNVIEIDAASNNGVDNIREIREEVSYRPTQGKYKVYIIDEVHMLSTGAFNALLKTLEEPPEYVIFILATTEVNKIPVTILSRCQRYNFHRISIDTISARVKELLDKEGVQAEDRAIRYIAKAADGSMRDALSLTDQCIAFYLGQELTYDRVLDVLGTVDTEVFSRMLREVIKGDAAACLRLLGDLVRDGKEMGQFVSDFTWYLRNLMLLKSSEDLEDVLDVSTENLKQLKEESRLIDDDTLFRYIRIFSDLSGRIRFATQKQILVETELIRLCRPQMDTDLSGVLDRIRVLEEKEEKTDSRVSALMEAGTVPRTAPAGSTGSGSSGLFSSADGRMASPGGAADPKGEQKAVMAAPEDLKKIREKWGQIKGSAAQPLRTYLDLCVPKYDSKNGGSRLFLELSDPTVQETLNSPDSGKMEELRSIIRKVTGKDVEVEAVLTGGAGEQHLNDIPLEEILENEIQMPVDFVDLSEEDT
ncbi:MAG: DNA polymerase III subunit gamma/tau [Eubacterium sp.]|jgi:DNA polymerase-3 subunit gamma/tau|nr:DNA polymerase III subunit gamma/tau [Eubacterium sp.]